MTGSTSRDAVHGAGGGLADDVAVAADGAAVEELDGALLLPAEVHNGSVVAAAAGMKGNAHVGRRVCRPGDVPGSTSFAVKNNAGQEKLGTTGVFSGSTGGRGVDAGGIGNGGGCVGDRTAGGRCLGGAVPSARPATMVQATATPGAAGHF